MSEERSVRETIKEGGEVGGGINGERWGGEKRTYGGKERGDEPVLKLLESAANA